MIGKRIGESHSPKVVSRLSIATARGKTSETANRVSHGEPGSEGIEGSQCRHMMLAQEPGRHHKGRNQSAGKHTASLQRVEGKDLAQVLPIHVPAAPIENYVQNFGAHDSSQHQGNAEIPRILSFYSLPN